MTISKGAIPLFKSSREFRHWPLRLYYHTKVPVNVICNVDTWPLELRLNPVTHFTQGIKNLSEGNNFRHYWSHTVVKKWPRGVMLYLIASYVGHPAYLTLIIYSCFYLFLFAQEEMLLVFSNAQRQSSCFIFKCNIGPVC